MAIALVTASSVAASTTGYPSGGQGAQGEVQGGGALPFTGLDLALIVLGGAALLVTGLLLRRAARSPK
jgi:hypothetical protein